MSNKNVIPVFYACDDNFINYAVVSMNSLITNASEEYDYKIHILNTGFLKESREKLLNLQRENVEICFEDVTQRMEEIQDRLPLRDYYSMTTYYRIFMADMFPQYDKAIYIDSDTVVLGDISEMYAYDLKDNLVGAVTDQVIVQEHVFSEYARKVLGLRPETYFNAGVLLMNCRALREEKVLERFIELINLYTFVVAQDQDYLNIICRDRVLWMHPKWNAEALEKIVCKEEEMAIIHYNLVSKPWHYPDCRLNEYFWKYAALTQVYDEILAESDNYTDEEREQDAYSGRRLLELAIAETTNVNNFYNLQKKEDMSEDRKKILQRIAQFEREGRFDEDVEEDPPAPVLMPEDIDYLHKGFSDKLKTKYAYNAAHWFVGVLLMKKLMIVKEIKGLDNLKNLDSGAIVTCNHFNPFDSFAVEIAFEKAKQHRKRKMYRVIREGNYTGFPGFYGFLMRNCNTLPLSSNMKTMKKFMEAVDELLGQGHFILVYPEQSMWWNYRKPKPLKPGAYKFAAKNNVPILPCFITMNDSDVMGDDGFYVQEYTIHIGEPIYPDAALSRADNVENMRKKNYEIWKNIYEETYQMQLAYTYDVGKIVQ